MKKNIIYYSLIIIYLLCSCTEDKVPKAENPLVLAKKGFWSPMTKDSIMLDNYKENVPIIIGEDTSNFYPKKGDKYCLSLNGIRFNTNFNKYVSYINMSSDTIIEGFEMSYEKTTNQLFLIESGDTLPYQHSLDKTIGLSTLEDWREKITMGYWREEDHYLIFSTRLIKTSNKENKDFEPYDRFTKVKNNTLKYEQIKDDYSIFFSYEHDLLFLSLAPVLTPNHSYTTYIVERIEEDRITLRCIRDVLTGKDYWEKVEWHKVENPSDTLKQIKAAYIKGEKQTWGEF